MPSPFAAQAKLLTRSETPFSDVRDQRRSAPVTHWKQAALLDCRVHFWVAHGALAFTTGSLAAVACRRSVSDARHLPVRPAGGRPYSAERWRHRLAHSRRRLDVAAWQHSPP